MRRGSASATATLVALIGILLPTACATSGLGNGATSVADATTLAGCGPSAAPAIDEHFAPVAGRFGPARWPSIRTADRRAVADPRTARVAGAPPLIPVVPSEVGWLQLALAELDGGLTMYYAQAPVGGAETIAEFLARGGLAVTQRPTAGRDRASDVVADVGSRAGLVSLAGHTAALVHADPLLRDDFRAYHLYWSDGMRDWTVQGVVQRPEVLIDIARSMYCP